MYILYDFLYMDFPKNELLRSDTRTLLTVNTDSTFIHPISPYGRDIFISPIKCMID